MTRIATVISITIIVPNRLASGVRCKTSSVVSVAQLYPTLCSPMDCSLPGPSVHGILQARILKCVANSFSRRSPWPRDWTQVSCILGRFFTIWASGEAWCKTRWDTNIEKKMTLCRSKKGPQIEHGIYQGRNKPIKINLICKKQDNIFHLLNWQKC